MESCNGETVVLRGLDEPVLDTQYFHQTTCDAGGHFEFTGLRPGDYYACAFTRVGDTYLLADLTFARNLQTRAAKVRVDKAETATVGLKLLPWPE